MPAFPERESTLLSKLYQSAPWTAKLHKTSGEESVGGATQEDGSPPPVNDIGQPVGLDSLINTTTAGKCSAILLLLSVSVLHALAVVL